MGRLCGLAWGLCSGPPPPPQMERDHRHGSETAEGPEHCCLSPRSQAAGKSDWLGEWPPHVLQPGRARFALSTGLEVSVKALALQPLQADSLPTAGSAKSSPSQGSVRMSGKAEPPVWSMSHELCSAVHLPCLTVTSRGRHPELLSPQPLARR